MPSVLQGYMGSIDIIVTIVERRASGDEFKERVYSYGKGTEVLKGIPVRILGLPILLNLIF